MPSPIAVLDAEASLMHIWAQSAPPSAVFMSFDCAVDIGVDPSGLIPGEVVELTVGGAKSVIFED